MDRKYASILALILLVSVILLSGCVECDETGCRIVPKEEPEYECGNGILEPGEQCESKSDCSLTEKCNDECECVPYIDLP